MTSIIGNDSNSAEATLKFADPLEANAMNNDLADYPSGIAKNSQA